MKLEDQVVSIKISKQLKKLNVKQNSYFYWYDVDYKSPVLLIGINNHYHYRDFGYSAFTVAELGVLLPCLIASSYGGDKLWHVWDDTEETPVHFTSRTEVDAKAKCLRWLIENNQIVVKAANI